MRHIYDNAVDSLRVGMSFYLDQKNSSSNKHAILTLFHSIELFLKEYLYRVNPILIYKNIDKIITNESYTVGIVDIFIRLENLKLGIPKSQKDIIKKIQLRRNLIEHHRYDTNIEDVDIISESLNFILFFTEFCLDEKLEQDIDARMLSVIQSMVFSYQERYSLARHRMDEWLHARWPDWDSDEIDMPDEFEGTHQCPNCRQEWLAIDEVEASSCFWCNTTVDAVLCDECGEVYVKSDGHECCCAEDDS